MQNPKNFELLYEVRKAKQLQNPKKFRLLYEGRKAKKLQNPMKFRSVNEVSIEKTAKSNEIQIAQRSKSKAKKLQIQLNSDQSVK